jgi:hypothetical protein
MPKAVGISLNELSFKDAMKRMLNTPPLRPRKIKSAKKKLRK